jgi:transaldolase
MNTTQHLYDLHPLGQSLRLDNITRALLTGGTLGRPVKGLADPGLTSNSTTFDSRSRAHAIPVSASH